MTAMPAAHDRRHRRHLLIRRFARVFRPCASISMVLHLLLSLVQSANRISSRIESHFSLSCRPHGAARFLFFLFFPPPARPGDETTHLGRECAVQLTVAREREVIQRAQVAERRRDATAQLRRLEKRGDRCGDDTSRSQRQRVIYGVVTVPARRPRILEAMAIKNDRTRRPPRPPPPPPYADELTRTDIIRHHQWHATETSERESESESESKSESKSESDSESESESESDTWLCERSSQRRRLRPPISSGSRPFSVFFARLRCSSATSLPIAGGRAPASALRSSCSVRRLASEPSEGGSRPRSPLS